MDPEEFQRLLREPGIAFVRDDVIIEPGRDSSAG
jgi:hypothetical protein